MKVDAEQRWCIPPKERWTPTNQNDFHDQTENYCRDIQDFTLETHRVLVVELDDAGTLQ